MFDFRNRNLGSSLAVAVPLRQSALPSPPSPHLLSLTFTLLPKVALRLATMSSQDSGALGGLAPQSASPPLPSSRENECRRSVDDLPPRFQSVFSSNFRHFNEIQSKLFEYLIGGDKTLVICSPTGSGKTVLLELAIIRELIKLDTGQSLPPQPGSASPFKNLHVLYLAPLKAIVEEKYLEWQRKFAPFGIKCFSLTGDTEFEDYNSAQITSYMNINILLATPEKFDHVIRTDPKSRVLLSFLNLVLIDEVHMLADRQRGDVLEATITRIKALRIKQAACSRVPLSPLRYIAISATVPNVSDIAVWLDSNNSLGVSIAAELRPVRLEKLVLGYEANPSASFSEFRFDIQLTYQLESLIRTHAEGKPVLVFCSTRKSVEFTAKLLSATQSSFFVNAEQRTQHFYELSLLMEANFDMQNGPYDNEGYFKNIDLKTSLAAGVGFYHSGMEHSDRRLLERLFAKSLIPVLVSTSSLAMGVNLPAHLVIVKNTVQYQAGSTVEYDASTVLQMIGRAGRPQFDTSAKAIIMTRSDKRRLYESLLNSDKVIESALARTLTEQLTVEMVLRTVTDLDTAVDWVSSTFMFIRVLSNPAYYGSDIRQGDAEGSYPFILEWCKKNISRLASLGLITLKSDGVAFEPTRLARIVTRYGISLPTTELMLAILREGYNLQTLLEKLCACRELSSDVILRVSDKRFLNEYNKKARFKSKEKIKTSLMKINCLLQASFESMQIDSSLLQDTAQVIRRGQCVSRCLIEICLYLAATDELPFDNSKPIPQVLGTIRRDMHLETILAAIQLMKAFRARLWHDSPLVTRQLSRIGPVLSNTLLEHGYDTFGKLLIANPRDIEFCLHRNPPFGSYIQEEVKSLPAYQLRLSPFPVQDPAILKILSAESVHSHFLLQLELTIEPRSRMGKMLLEPSKHSFILLVGCHECNQLISIQRLKDLALEVGDSIVRKVAVVQTKLEYPEKTDSAENSGDGEYDDLFELSSQVAAGSKGKRKAKNTGKKKAASKKAKMEKEKAREKRVDTVEFLRVVEQLENAGGNQLLLHCTYRNHQRHTIQAMVISESFVGIDVEQRVPVQLDVNSAPGAPISLIDTHQPESPTLKPCSTASSFVSAFTSSEFSGPLEDGELERMLMEDFTPLSESASVHSEAALQIKSETNIASSELSVGTTASSQLVAYSQFEEPDEPKPTETDYNQDGIANSQSWNMASEGASTLDGERSSLQNVAVSFCIKRETITSAESPRNSAHATRPRSNLSSLLANFRAKCFASTPVAPDNPFARPFPTNSAALAEPMPSTSRGGRFAGDAAERNQQQPSSTFKWPSISSQNRKVSQYFAKK